MESYLKTGSELYRTHHLAPGRFGLAIQYYEIALSRSPDDYRILWKLSEMYQNFGQQMPTERKEEKITSWEKGTAYGKRAVEVNPNGKEGHFYYLANMGALADIKGTLHAFWRLRKIRREMGIATELDPDYPPLLLARAPYLLKMPRLLGGSRQEALQLYQRAIKQDPSCSLAHYFMAQMDASQGRYERAAARLEKMLPCENPDNQGNWMKHHRPRAERLLQEIRPKRDPVESKMSSASRTGNQK